ncbi:SH3 domain-containing protein [Pontibacter sp. G13]|uniref:SH3 domain-containing protein n=1 Tax=Pontibacter sp. G13 TaxID=3074898 RepID=UPI00288AA25A|nr:SH3 domain-containing protein [Pontibacter sp. G13]WNJ17531.1 SH3 domain-containing protein [Pontibacter sp. G13]
MNRLSLISLFGTSFTLLVWLMVLPVSSLAQYGGNIQFDTGEHYLFPEEAPTYFLLGNDILMRKCPSKECTALASLKIGTPIRVIEKSEEPLTLKGVSVHWYKIKTSAGVGWIWGGWIAQGAIGSSQDPSVKFLAGYDRIEDRNHYYQIRVIKNGVEIDKIVIKSPTGNDYFQHFGSLGKKAMPNLHDILTVHVPGKASCGHWSGEVLIAWNGEKLVEMGTNGGIGDAEFSSSEYHIWPGDIDGVPGLVIRVSADTDQEEFEEDGEIRYRAFRKIRRSYLRWDGTKLAKTSKPAEVETYQLGEN